MPINWNTFENQRLINVICSFRTPDKLRLFLDDLLTEKEIGQIVKRLQVVTLIYAGAPYEAITDITGMSSTTISRISKALINKKGGFWEALHKLYPNGYHSIDSLYYFNQDHKQIRRQELIKHRITQQMLQEILRR